MAVMPVQPPTWRPDGGGTGVPQNQRTPIMQGSGGAVFADWPSGMFLYQATTGTIATPNPNGSLATLPGPITFTNAAQTSQVTIGTSAVAGAPAMTYWVALTYIGAADIESLPSPTIPIAVPAGFVPTVNVSASGAPAAATKFGVYAGLFSRIWYRQSIATNLGSTYTFAYPLTNYTGAAPIVAGTSANILGLAECDALQIVDPLSAFPGVRNPYGPTMSTAPLQGQNALWPYMRAGFGLFELNMIQGYSDGMIGQAIGLNIDATSGMPVWDTTQTQCAVIAGHQGGQYQGVSGDTYARVLGRFLAASVI